MDFLKAYLRKHPFLKTYVLGISGGQDSTLAGRLAQLAVEEMRAETRDDSYRFIAVRLPYVFKQMKMMPKGSGLYQARCQSDSQESADAMTRLWRQRGPKSLI